MTVGEIIASHHCNDALWRARAADKAFAATDVGRAFIRFRNSYGEAWRKDTELGFDGLGLVGAKKQWERADVDEAVFRTHLERLMRQAL